LAVSSHTQKPQGYDEFPLPDGIMAIRARFTFLRMLNDTKTGWLSAFSTQLLLLYLGRLSESLCFSAKEQTPRTRFSVLIVPLSIRFEGQLGLSLVFFDSLLIEIALRSDFDEIKSQVERTGRGDFTTLGRGQYSETLVSLMAKNPGDGIQGT